MRSLVVIGVVVIGWIAWTAMSGAQVAVEDSRDAMASTAICAEAKEAAHYIAARSYTQDDVVRVTDQVIADRKYPAMGDKMTALIGGVVGLSLGSKTPDEISEIVGAGSYCQR